MSDPILAIATKALAKGSWSFNGQPIRRDEIAGAIVRAVTLAGYEFVHTDDICTVTIPAPGDPPPVGFTSAEVLDILDRSLSIEQLRAKHPHLGRHKPS